MIAKISDFSQTGRKNINTTSQLWISNLLHLHGVDVLDSFLKRIIFLTFSS